jgi:hypothetical protein
MPPKRIRDDRESRTETTKKQRSKFRFQSSKAHLTYKHHLDHDKLIEQFNKHGGGFIWYSLCHEHGHGSHSIESEEPIDYPHTHFAFEYLRRIDTANERFFDFEHNGETIHPNIKQIQNTKHALNIWEYHGKEGIKLTQSEKNPENSKGLIQRIRECSTLGEAIEVSGVPVKSVSDLVAIRRDVKRREPFKHNFPDTIWTFHGKITRAAFVWGPSNTGKTQWALGQFTNPLLVRHMDSLKDLTPENDGIVFDDMSFKHLPRSTIIFLLDWDEESHIHIRHTTARIPKHTRKVFTSNLTWEDTFGDYSNDVAITRRFTERHHIVGPTWDTNGIWINHSPLELPNASNATQYADTFEPFNDRTIHEENAIRDSIGMQRTLLEESDDLDLAVLFEDDFLSYEYLC